MIIIPINIHFFTREISLEMREVYENYFMMEMGAESR